MGHPAAASGNRLRIVYFTGAILLFVLPSAACSRQKSTAEAADKAPGSSSAIADASPAAPEPKGPLPAINAARAFQYTKEVTGFGPRPIGKVADKADGPGTIRDDRGDVERAIEEADPSTDFGSDVPRELIDAAREELLAAPADETDEG